MKFTKRDLPESNGGGVFLKFKDGESKVGVLRGEIYEFFQKWVNGKSQIVSAADPEGKSRFRANFVTKEDGEQKAKVFEFGLTIYNQLADLSDEYDIEKTGLKITRRGTGTDTVYTIIPSKEQPTPAQIKALDSLKLNILEHKDKPAEGQGGEFKSSGDEEIPF